MLERRIRTINFIDFKEAIYASTISYGLELSNWLNADVQFSLISQNDAVKLNEQEKQLESLIKSISIGNELLAPKMRFSAIKNTDDFSGGFDHEVCSESLSLMGFNNSGPHRKLLTAVLKHKRNHPLLLLPRGQVFANIHQLILPFSPEYLTKRSLKQIHWVCEHFGMQLVLAVAHDSNTAHEAEIIALIKQWIAELDFTTKVKFKMLPIPNALKGVKMFFGTNNNCLLALADKKVKSQVLPYFQKEDFSAFWKQPLLLL